MLGLTDIITGKLMRWMKVPSLKWEILWFLHSLTGLRRTLNIIMLPSPPQLVIDMPHAAIESIIASQEFS